MSARPSALIFLWRNHRAALIAMGLALAVAAFFAVRLTVFTIYWADPAHREQRIEGWMTPGYVARSWDVDPEVIRTALPAPPEARPGTRPTLAQIAEAEGIALSELIARLDTAIAGAQAE
jgi:hypothetical protein